MAPQQLPAYLRRSENVNKFLAGLGANQPPEINRLNNRFTLVDGAGNRKPVQSLTLDVIIIDASEFTSKSYYPAGYDPNDPAPPDCFSDNGIGPSTLSTKPQNDLCATCPRNEWGSAQSKISGKNTKECADRKKVACLVPSDGMDKPIVYLLAIPAGSFKHLKQFMQTLGGHGCEPQHIITRIGFDTSPGATQGLLTFEPAGWVTEQQARTTDALLEAKATDYAVGRLDKPRAASTALRGPAADAPLNSLPGPVPAAEEKFFNQEMALRGQTVQEEAAPAVDPQLAAFQVYQKQQAEIAAAAAEADRVAEAAKRAAAEAARAKANEVVRPPGMDDGQWASYQAFLAMQKGAAAPADDGKLKRTRRTKEQIAADEAAKAQARPNETVAGPGAVMDELFPTKTATPAATQQQFGMQQTPLPPDDEMEKMLADVFALPT